MSAPLTSTQRRYLARLAREAWQGSPEADAQDQTTFRHEQVAAAAGKLGLQCCSQDDYGAVKARLLHLLGRDDQALAADLHGRPELNERRVAYHKIRQRCRELGLSLNYADAVCRRMTRGRSLHQVEQARTLWNVYFKLRKAATPNKTISQPGNQ